MTDAATTDATSPLETGQHLGGWLIAAGLQLVLNPLLAFVSSYLLLCDLPLDHQQRLYVVVSIAIAVVISGLAPIPLLVLFFRRGRRFPGLFMTWVCAIAAVNLVDGAASNTILGTPPWGPSNMATTVYGVLFWVPYFMKSHRVKNTFVN